MGFFFFFFGGGYGGGGSDSLSAPCTHRVMLLFGWGNIHVWLEHYLCHDGAVTFWWGSVQGALSNAYVSMGAMLMS